MWVSVTTVDGLDASIGLARILAGTQIYFQDRDNAANWVKYNVTADGVDDGTYYDYVIAYHSGPGGIPAGQIEFQLITPGTVGVPPSGGTGQVLAKESSADYDVTWIDAPSVTRSINAQTGTTYTLTLTDAGKLVTLSNAAAVTLTVPATSTVGFAVGTAIDLAQLGAGKVTVSAAGGVTVNAASSTKAFRAQYSAASLVKLGTDSWILLGDLET